MTDAIWVDMRRDIKIIFDLQSRCDPYLLLDFIQCNITNEEKQEIEAAADQGGDYCGMRVFLEVVERKPNGLIEFCRALEAVNQKSLAVRVRRF